MALTKTVKKAKVKKTKSRKTSPAKKGEKLGRQQPKKKVIAKKDKVVPLKRAKKGDIVDTNEFANPFDDDDYLSPDEEWERDFPDGVEDDVDDTDYDEPDFGDIQDDSEDK